MSSNANWQGAISFAPVIHCPTLMPHANIRVTGTPCIRVTATTCTRVMIAGIESTGHCILKVHQVFWDVMDQLDRETWVLEPQQPKPDSICRRIVVCKAFSNRAHSVANFFVRGS